MCEFAGTLNGLMISKYYNSKCATIYFEIIYEQVS